MRPSRALARACALFGLRVKRDPFRKPEREALRLARYVPDARRLQSLLAPGRVVLVTGDSGSGKSTLLELLARRLKLLKKRVRTVTDPLDAARRNKPVFELLGGRLDARLRTLASCALADATLLARRADELSDGQRARLAIAVAARRAREGDTLICDEFASTLDRVTAMGLSYALARWAARERVQVVVATGNDDVAGALNATIFRIDSNTSPARKAA